MAERKAAGSTVLYLSQLIHCPFTLRCEAGSPVEHSNPTAYRTAMARLSVNLNKIALLRNARRTGVPDLGRFARLALDAGAQGLTVHPRPDERHIRGADVSMLARLMAAER